MNHNYIVKDLELRKIIDKHQYSVDDLIRPICTFLNSIELKQTPEDTMSALLANTSLKIEDLFSNFMNDLQRNTRNNAITFENAILHSIPQQANTVALEVTNKTFPLVQESTRQIIKLDEKITNLTGNINNLSDEITKLKTDKLVKQTGSATKGLDCEMNYVSLLQERLPAEWICNHIGSVRSTSGNMDIELKRGDSLTINVEIKNYANAIGGPVINKFLEDANKKNNSAIIISANSDFVGYYNRKILEFKPNKFAIFLSKNNYNYTDIYGAIEVISLLESTNIKSDGLYLTDEQLLQIEDDFNEFAIMLNAQKQRTTHAYEQTMAFFKKLEFTNTKHILKIASQDINKSIKNDVFKCICDKIYKTEINFNKHKLICGRY